MNNEIVEYIKTQSKAGHSKALITSALKNAGYTDVEISGALSRIDDDTRSIPAPPPKSDGKPTSITKSKPMDITKVFVFLGSLLILIAVIVIIFSQWENVNALTRVLFIGLPMLILFAISALTPKDDVNESISNTTLVTATIIFPFFIGTFLYQFKIIDEINALLFAISALSCFILCTIFEFGLQKKNFTVLSIVSFWTAVFAIEIHLNLNEELLIWSSLIIAKLVLLFGFYLLKIKKSYANLYIIMSTIAICYIFPLAVTFSLHKHANLSEQGNYVVISLFTIFYLIIASLYNRLRFYFPDSPLYSLKRVLEEISPLVLIYPLLLAGYSTSHFVNSTTNNSDYIYTIVAIILSILIVLGSYKVRIKSMLWVGSLGLATGILSITADLFDFTSVGWPIIIFVVGFIFIGIGLLLRKLSLAQQNEHPPMIWGIGEDPTMANVKSNMPAWQRIFIVLIVIIAGNLMYENLAYNSYNSNDYNYNYDQSAPVNYDKNAVVDTQIGYVDMIYITNDNNDHTRVTEISIKKNKEYYGTFTVLDTATCVIDGNNSKISQLKQGDYVSLDLNSQQTVIAITATAIPTSSQQ